MNESILIPDELHHFYDEFQHDLNSIDERECYNVWTYSVVVDQMVERDLIQTKLEKEIIYDTDNNLFKYVRSTGLIKKFSDGEYETRMIKSINKCFI